MLSFWPYLIIFPCWYSVNISAHMQIIGWSRSLRVLHLLAADLILTTLTCHARWFTLWHIRKLPFHNFPKEITLPHLSRVHLYRNMFPYSFLISVMVQSLQLSIIIAVLKEYFQLQTLTWTRKIIFVYKNKWNHFPHFIL